MQQSSDQVKEYFPFTFVGQIWQWSPIETTVNQVVICELRHEHQSCPFSITFLMPIIEFRGLGRSNENNDQNKLIVNDTKSSKGLHSDLGWGVIQIYGNHSDLRRGFRFRVLI